MNAARLAGLDLALRALFVAALAAALAAHARGGRYAVTASVGLAALLVCDLGSVSAPMLRRATGRIGQLSAPAPPPLGRALALERATMLSNDWVAWRARSITGKHAAVIGTWEDLLSRGLLRRHPALCALAARYVAGDGSVAVDTASCERVLEGGAPTPVLRLREALPRAYAVPRVLAPGSDDAVISSLFADDFDPRATAFTNDPEAAGDYPGSRRCGVRWIEDSPDRIALETEAPARAFLVVADAYFAGWQARVDDRPARLFRVNHLVRGVAVPPGRHRIAMRYRPEGWSAGVWSTRASMAVILVLALGLAVFTLVTRGAGRVARS